MQADQPTTGEARGLYEEALAVESPEELDALWERMERFAPYERPVGDRWGNRGLFTAAGGNFDHKLTELVVNMLDSLLLRQAFEVLGEDVLDPVKSADLFDTPAAAVHELFGPGEPPRRHRSGSCGTAICGPNQKARANRRVPRPRHRHGSR